MDRPRLVIAVAAALPLAACDDGAADRPDSAAAAAGIRAVIADAQFDDEGIAALERCPSGFGLDVVADGLGAAAAAVAAGGERASVAVRDATAVTCGASGGGEVWLLASADPAGAAARLGEQPEPLGTAEGGTFEGHCADTDAECVVLWRNGDLLVAVGGSGEAFADVSAPRARTALQVALPTIVGELAGN